MQWTKLVPRDSILIQSDNKIIITNSCGDEFTKFKNTKLIFGPSRDKYLVSNIIGEWCQSNYAVTHDSILIHAVLSEGQWHTVFSEEIYKLESGREIIAPMHNINIGDLNFDDLRNSINEKFYLGDTEDYSEDRLDHLIRKGYIYLEGKEVLLESGIYIEDLEKAFRAGL